MMKFLEKNFDFTKLFKSVSTILLFYYSSIFNLLPIYIFKINIDTISNKVATYLSVYSSIILLFILIVIYYKDIVREIKNFTNNLLSNINTGFKWWLVGLFIMYVSNMILLIVFKSGGANNENAVQTLIDSSPIAMGFYTCLLAPIVEEFVFRKTLKDFFKNKWLFVLASFLFFGGAHVFTMAENIIDWLYIIPYGAVGATFAYAYYKTDSICTSTLFHIIHNSSLFFLSLIV